ILFDWSLAPPGRSTRMLPFCWFFAAPFAPLVVVRLRQLSLGRQALVTVAAGGVLALPGLVLAANVAWPIVHPILTAAARPLVFASALGDVAERRLAVRLERG